MVVGLGVLSLTSVGSGVLELHLIVVWVDIVRLGIHVLK